MTRAGSYRWVAAGLILLSIWAFFYLRGDRRQISRRLDHIEELMSKEGPEDSLVSFAIVREISALFSEGFVAHAEPWQDTMTDRQQLTGALMRYRTAAQAIDLKIGGRELEIDGELGLATLRGVSEVVMDFRGQKGRERREIRIEWVKEDGDWLIREVELLEPIGDSFSW